MKRRWAAVAAGLLLAGLVGCDNPPPPVNEAKPIEKPQQEELTLTPPARPDRSGEDGAKLLAEVLNAHTGGKPDKLAALRECSFTRKGVIETPNGRVPSAWSVKLVWPDLYRADTELTLPQGFKGQASFGLTKAGGWRRKGEGAAKETLESPDLADLIAKFHEDALFLLFTLADPKTVVTQGTDEKVGDTELHVLHAWTPGLEYARLGVDAKTKLLTRFTYNGREMNVPVVKEMVFTEYKEFAGVKLGSKVYIKGGGKLLFEWTELTVDATKPDPKVFDGQ
jgi:hypothetical protein